MGFSSGRASTMHPHVIHLRAPRFLLLPFAVSMTSNCWWCFLSVTVPRPSLDFDDVVMKVNRVSRLYVWHQDRMSLMMRNKMKQDQFKFKFKFILQSCHPSSSNNENSVQVLLNKQSITLFSSWNAAVINANYCIK